MNIFESTAPGKIILSGEHSVVYGCPALAMAVNKHCKVTLQVTSKIPAHEHIIFNLSDYNWQQIFTKDRLLLLLQRVEKKYEEFLAGKCAAGEIFKEPQELAVYAAVLFMTTFAANNFSAIVGAFNGLNCTIASAIPIGCGMGSSAAMIVAVGRVLQKYMNQEIESSVFLSMAKEVENVQHGYSSGVDLYLAYHGGAVLFNAGKITARNIPSKSRFLGYVQQIPLGLVNTGESQSSTGECIMQAKKFFKMQSLLDDFTSVTLAMDRALQEKDCLTVQKCVYENNKLLCYVGVVPPKVQEFIGELERRNLSAKISGAGAVMGDGAGIVLVFGDDKIDDLLVKYNYSKMPVGVDEHGVKVEATKLNYANTTK